MTVLATMYLLCGYTSLFKGVCWLLRTNSCKNPPMNRFTHSCNRYTYSCDCIVRAIVYCT